MKRFTTGGRGAIQSDNLYAALTLALTIPDICGSLEDPGPGKSQRRYEAWFKKWAEPKFQSNGGKSFVSAHDCYQIRCSLVHSGTAEIDPKKRDILHQFVFFDKTATNHLMWCEANIYNGVKQPNYLQLKADLFSETMFQSADEWDAAMVSDKKVQAEKARLLVIHPGGTAFGGIRFV